MSAIDRPSTFRGNIVDHGVGKSTNGYPQWVASLVAVEIYDDEEKVWVDWSQYDVNEITTYQVLFGGKGETLAVQQLKKITGWDGVSFVGLAVLDLTETKIQFRVESSTYKEKTSLQVTWIDEYDAEPGRAIRKLGNEDLRALDAQYKQFLGKKTVPTKAPVGKPKVPASKPKVPTKVKAKNIKSTQPKGPVKKKVNDPLGPPASPALGSNAMVDKAIVDSLPDLPSAPPTRASGPPPDPTVNTQLPTGHCTKVSAWEAVHELKKKNITNEQIDNIWLDVIQEVAPGARQSQITNEQWFLVQEKVLEKTAIF